MFVEPIKKTKVKTKLNFTISSRSICIFTGLLMFVNGDSPSYASFSQEEQDSTQSSSNMLLTSIFFP